MMQRGLYSLLNRSKSINGLVNNSNQNIIICTNNINRGGVYTLSSKLQYNNTTTRACERSYATFSDKKFEAIKKRRDEEARIKKVEAEQKFIEEARISIDDLSFQDALNNLRDKFNKYAVVANAQMTTLFRKTQSMEELETALLFYKSIRNGRPDYFNSEQIATLYYAFDRADAWILWADVIMNTHTFQIFASSHLTAKTIYQLLRIGSEETNEKAIQMFNDRIVRYSGVTNRFIQTIATGLVKTNQIERIYPLLNLKDPRVHVNSDAIKIILRSSFKNNTTKQALEALEPYLPTAVRMDAVCQVAILVARVFAQPELSTSLIQEYKQFGEKGQKRFAKEIELITEDLSDPEEKEKVKSTFSNFLAQC